MMKKLLIKKLLLLKIKKFRNNNYLRNLDLKMKESTIWIKKMLEELNRKILLKNNNSLVAIEINLVSDLWRLLRWHERH